eukprot:scaffold116786_cov48-Attheya_sp.AAC.1
MINLSGDVRSLRFLYILHVKVCDDQDLLKDKYDDQFSGLLFFIGGVNMGQAPHLKTPAEILPIHADQLFNLGEDKDDFCKFIEKKMTNPKLVKSIQAVYRVLLTGKQGVVEQLCSFYDPWVNAPNARSQSPSPSPPSESSSLASLKTSNTTAATLTASARRAELSANIPFDEEGFHDVDACWDASVEAVKAMDPDLPPGWPPGAAKPDNEVAAMFNLAHMFAELNEEATKACAANIAEEELEKETHKKAEAAAILAKVKATPAAVVAVAEATKSANIVALAAYPATKKTKIAEDEATAKHVQEKAAAAVLADAELVQEKAATAAILADVEVTKAANVAAALAKAAEDEAAAKLVEEKAAAAAAANIAKAAEDEAAAKLVQVKAATAAVLADAEVTKAANVAAANIAKAAEDEAAAKLVEEKAAAAAAANIVKAAEDEAAAKL